MFITDANRYNFKQGDEIEFFISNEFGPSRGRIAGMATNPVAGAGPSYIVEILDGKIPSENYPFTHMVVFESAITNHPNRELSSALY